MLLLTLLGIAQACGRAPEPPSAPPSLVERIDASLRRAREFLSGKQGADGAFRSSRYAAFRDGTALSFMPLIFLRQLPDHDARAYARGVDFLATLGTDEARRDEMVRTGFPVYSLAGTILVLNMPDNARHDQARAVLVAELRRMQLSEDNGWPPTDPSYGGWGYFGGVPRRAGDAPSPALSSNLSATLWAVGALRLAGVPPEDPALVRARAFVERCQNYAGSAATADPAHDDGGFFFGPGIPDSNKAGAAGVDRHGVARYRSYGSMTADGLRALLKLGLGVDHPRVRAAARWLERRWRADQNPGDYPDTSELRRDSAYYYYVWSSAHALRAQGMVTLATEAGPRKWPEDLAEELLSRQRRDGSWANRYTEMREDEPLVATPMAAAALAVARIVLTGEYRTHAR